MLPAFFGHLLKINSKPVRSLLYANYHIGNILCANTSVELDTDEYPNILKEKNIKNQDSIEWNTNNVKTNPASLLEPCLEDVSYIAPVLKPVFNFAAYADKAPIIQKLMDMGVDFYKFEQRKNIPTYLLQLDFEKNVEPYIRFLKDIGVPENRLGPFITKNPFIFQEDIEDLKGSICVLATCPSYAQEQLKILVQKGGQLQFYTFFQERVKTASFSYRISDRGTNVIAINT